MSEVKAVSSTDLAPTIPARYGQTQLEQFRGFWALKMAEMLGFAVAAPVMWC
jgi:hypothetical protein